jgi:hypothetical protein
MARMYSVMAAGQGGGGGGSAADLAGASVFWVREGERVWAHREIILFYLSHEYNTHLKVSYSGV